MSAAGRKCPVCRRKPGGAVIASLDCTVGCKLSRAQFDLRYCQCGELVYLDPAPSDADLRVMYEDSVQFSDALYTEPARIEVVLEYMRTSFEHVRAHQGAGNSAAKILEVGAGFAWMCRAAKTLRADHFTVAQDVSPEVATSCPWVDRYIRGTVHERAVADLGPYDVISLTHVIEHLVDPVGVIDRCMHVLKDDGVVFVTAPHRPRDWSAGSLDGKPWQQYSLLHVPAHVQYFSRGSMQRLARRVGASLVHWDGSHEGGEAFEAWLARDPEHARGWKARGRQLLRRLVPQRERL